MFEVIAINEGGDEYSQGAFNNKSEAIEKAFSHWTGLTSIEQKTQSVEVREIESNFDTAYDLVMEFSLNSFEQCVENLKIMILEIDYLELEYGLDLYSGYGIADKNWLDFDEEPDRDKVYVVKNSEEYYEFNESCIEFINNLSIYENGFI